MALLGKYFVSLRDRTLLRLNADVRNYQQRIYNNLENLYRFIRPGDVVLVEGRSRVSRIIQVLSNSHWSHVAMYVGDALGHQGYRSPDFGVTEADFAHMLIEAFPGQGVIAAPLSKYREHNIRVCRPFGIRKRDLQQVIAEIIGQLGKRYDQQNIIDLALLLLPSWLNPFKKKSTQACLGKCNDFDVICSGMIARAFQNVGYPIVPTLCGKNEAGHSRDNPYGARLQMRHFSQILPRDFDLSPNFDIIKFNIIKTGSFDYKRLEWENAAAAPGNVQGSAT